MSGEEVGRQAGWRDRTADTPGVFILCDRGGERSAASLLHPLVVTGRTVGRGLSLCAAAPLQRSLRDAEHVCVSLYGTRGMSLGQREEGSQRRATAWMIERGAHPACRRSSVPRPTLKFAGFGTLLPSFDFVMSEASWTLRASSAIWSQLPLEDRPTYLSPPPSPAKLF